MAGGAWGVMIRRPLEAGTRTLYVMWLAVPAAADSARRISIPGLIPRMPAKASDKIIQPKHLYLNSRFYGSAGLFTAWSGSGLTYLLNKWSRLEDETKSWKYSNKLEKLSAPGIVLYFFTMTFCSVDYLMSLDVTWASTIYGFLIADGQALSAMCVDGGDAGSACEVSRRWIMPSRRSTCTISAS